MRYGHADYIVCLRVGCAGVRACNGSKNAEMNRIRRIRRTLFGESAKVALRYRYPGAPGTDKTVRSSADLKRYGSKLLRIANRVRSLRRAGSSAASGLDSTPNGCRRQSAVSYAVTPAMY